MGLIGCPETSGRNYHYLLRNNPEECSSELYSFVSRLEEIGKLENFLSLNQIGMIVCPYNSATTQKQLHYIVIR
jgi:hypothetical protein